MTHSPVSNSSNPARSAIAETKYFFFCFVAMLGIAACHQTIRLSPGPPGSCPSVFVDYQTQPTAAVTISGTSGSNSNNGHEWGAVDAAGADHFLNVGFVPQTGWSLPSPTKGLAFSQFTHRPSQFIGIGPVEGRRFDYVLEYTLPPAQCDMAVGWDTYLSITLPNGICATDDGNPATCKNGAQVAAKLDMYAVNDPTGTMSVTGSGLTALKTAIDAQLRTVVQRRRIAVSSNTPGKLQKTSYFDGNFNVAQGVRAHVYVGVAVLLQKDTDGWACLRVCVTSPSDRLVDFGTLTVEGGSGIGLGVVMSRRNP